ERCTHTWRAPLCRRRAHSAPRSAAAATARRPPEVEMASKAKELSLFDPEIIGPAVVASLRKLLPQHVARNPVMFVVEVGSVVTTLVWVRDLFAPGADAAPAWFSFGVSAWLWFTVIFANFAEAVAEGRGQAQAATLRKMRKETTARRLVGGREER